MKYVLQIQRIFEWEGSDDEMLGIFDTPEDAMKAFPRAKEWEYYTEPYTRLKGYTSLLKAKGNMLIYAHIVPVEEHPEEVDTIMYKEHFNDV